MSDYLTSYREWLLASLLCLLSFPLAAQVSPVGSETQNNLTTTHAQQNPDIAMDALGNFIIVWESHLTDGSGFGIYGQRFNRDGNANGSEFLINTYTTGNQRFPAVAMDDDGDHVVVWMDEAKDGNGWGVFGQRYNNSYGAVGSEFQINSANAYHSKFPAVAMDDNGNFTVAWQRVSLDGTSFQVRARRFLANGTPNGGEFSPRSASASYQGYPEVGMDADGDFVLVWQRQPGSNSMIMIQPYNKNGVQIGGNFPIISGSPANAQHEPSVSMDQDGNYVIAWESVGRDGDGKGVYAALLPAGTSNPISNEFLVNSTTSGHQMEPVVAMNEQGGFSIAWTSYDQDGSNGGIYAQAYYTDGVANGGEMQVNSTTANFQQFPAMMQHDSANELVIVWQDGMRNGSSTADGDDYGIFSQRYSLFTGSFPVEWLSFDARPAGSTALLSWETGSELNNEGFQVEHSVDAILWTQLDFVPGMGSSSEGQQYDYTHLHPQQGVNYYRLKQIDFNGAYAYSEIRAVSMGLAGAELSLYPNPTAGELNFNQAVSGNILIRNQLGQMVWQESGEEIRRLDLSQLSEGAYYLQYLDQSHRTRTANFLILK